MRKEKQNKVLMAPAYYGLVISETCNLSTSIGIGLYIHIKIYVPKYINFTGQRWIMEHDWIHV